MMVVIMRSMMNVVSIIGVRCADIVAHGRFIVSDRRLDILLIVVVATFIDTTCP